jgi:hypothetical protein
MSLKVWCASSSSRFVLGEIARHWYNRNSDATILEIIKHMFHKLQFM